MRLCFVVQRYGTEVNGGAEAYARQVAEHMASIGGHDVSCITTKAVDYVTWKNEYEKDEEDINGVHVYRFPVIKERDTASFNKLSARILTSPSTVEEQEEWMRQQGPNSPALADFVESVKDDYDCFIFVCYLYYSTYFGLPRVKDKAILIPTAHDEAPIYLDIFNKMFSYPAAFYYNTVEEKELTNDLFDVTGKPDNDGRGGVGIELPSKIDPEGFKQKFGVDDFFIYVGRIDENKCCNILFDYFAEYKKRNPDSKTKLVLMGKEVIEVPKRDDIMSLGFVSEEDKFSGIAASRFLVQFRRRQRDLCIRNDVYINFREALDQTVNTEVVFSRVARGSAIPDKEIRDGGHSGIICDGFQHVLPLNDGYRCTQRLRQVYILYKRGAVSVAFSIIYIQGFKTSKPAPGKPCCRPDHFLTARGAGKTD